MDTIFFTHIPKTAGTSLRHAVITPHVEESDMRHSKGVKDLLLDRSLFRFMRGHYPYGVHRIAPVRGQARYFVMLRDPVKRALSFYYHAATSRSENYEHPAYEDTCSHDLVSFFGIPKGFVERKLG